MVISPGESPVVFIVGATASGKSATAMALARRYGGEVVNADSRQVYRHMDIGTAKPSLDDRAAVRHHLLDVADPDQGYSLALFLAQARRAIADIHGRGRLPLVVGGTGQYVWGLVEGWQVPEVPPQEELRERLVREAQERGVQALHRRLQRVDAAAARSIDPRNVRRVVRALEVWQVTGLRFSAQQRREPTPFAPHVLGLWVPREKLHRRIDARVEAMVEAGWLEEARTLLERGYAPELPSFSSAGYRELTAYLQGRIGWEEALAQTRTAVRRLARRQGAWFRREDPRIHWCDEPSSLIGEISKLGASPVVESARTSEGP